MSQAEVTKSRIIGVVWSQNGSSSADGSGNGSAHQPRARTTDSEHEPSPSRTALVLQEPKPEVITTFAWKTSPVSLVEEVGLRTPLDPRLVTLTSPRAPQAVSYRRLQNRLLVSQDPRVIVVTSAEPGAGKTTCAANLALVLAENPQARVLLVDANLARPGIADVFGFEPRYSFMTQLLDNEAPTQPYAVASIGGCALQLAALNAEVAPGRRLAHVPFGETIRDLRSVYDYIVVDGASVLESTDVNDVSQFADGVIVAARAGKSRSDQLRRAIDQLQPARVVGSVLIHD